MRKKLPYALLAAFLVLSLLWKECLEARSVFTANNIEREMLIVN